MHSEKHYSFFLQDPFQILQFLLSPGKSYTSVMITAAQLWPGLAKSTSNVKSGREITLIVSI